MLSRRNAILAASSAFAVGSTGRALEAHRTASSIESGDQRAQLRQNAAVSCMKCSVACAESLAVLPRQVQPLAQDCRDICNTTATLLSRTSSTAPAVCQACHDACVRLTDAISATHTNDASTRQFQIILEQCARDCSAIIQAS